MERMSFMPSHENIVVPWLDGNSLRNLSSLLNKEQVNKPMLGWDSRWMEMARLVATWSKDRSRTCGAVIVDYRNVLVSIGWNGFPRRINDDVDARHERPAKYRWTEHAERNAIYNAAANGHPTLDCTMYLSWYPCADCARAIIQSGICIIVCTEPDWNDHIWAADFAVVREMLEESAVTVRFI